jgi:flagellin-specific chaperone FliS
MKKYIVQLYNSKEESITTIELKVNSLSEVETKVQQLYNGWATILSVVVTSV